MRVPPYHQEPGWQRFFAGVVLGAVIGWVIFILIYGALQEKQVGNLIKYKKQVEQHEKTIHILTEDNDKLKEERDKLKIDDIKIDIINHDKYMLNSLSRFSIIADIKDDLSHLISEEVESIAEHQELLIKTIENKGYKLDEKTYYFRVYSLVIIDTTIEIDLVIEKLE
ncbi:sporulation membrane protein YtrI [Sutcliffiella halmapala]|uniref:sporulation membrane protein YtrI n=1 Tax=Sutcliffiella halmapala TaxID=79882 RepID=UPI00099554E4|nr:sporulation membrane protein YtrI [Sutcliffiella halmapala]